MPAPLIVFPTIFAAVGAFLIRYGPTVIVYILGALGVGFGTYKGTGIIMEQIEEQLIANFSGLPTNVLCIYSSLGVDQFVSTVLTGMTMGLTIKAGVKAVRLISLRQLPLPL